MSIIHRLDSVTANSIAAGEVVERPASVVKELCENALDAGASIIHVNCLGGGIKRIQISDNGVGMDSEDALEAFERHATSKLRQIEDLDEIVSMGFRGEALAAISSVARVSLQTRQRGADSGTRVYIEGGELLEHLPCACQEGSNFIVEDLFFNTPARYKFLKKDQTETARITEVVQRLALARPDVSFRLTHGGQNVLHTPGNNELRSAIYAVFGKELADNSIEIPQTEAENAVPVQLSGYIGLPLAARRNRNYQLFYVNERLVKSPVLTKALDEAYASLAALMHGQYAFAVLKLSIPPNLLDINVHPQKMEVRFWNEQSVFSALYHIVKTALEKGLRHPADHIPTSEPIGKNEGKAFEKKADEMPALPQYRAQALPDLQQDALFRWNTAGAKESAEQAEKRADVYADPSDEGLLIAENRLGDVPNVLGASQEVLDAESAATLTSNASAEAALEPATPSLSAASVPVAAGSPAAQAVPSLLDAVGSGRLVGQLFDTYILIENQDAYYLIDQHAAHEKVLYERLLIEFSNGEAHQQGLIAPELLPCGVGEMAALRESEDFVRSLGFDFDFFSEQDVLLRALPASLAQNDARGTFMVLLDSLADEELSLELSENRERLRLLFATRACKAAVKAHDRLSSVEISSLIAQLSGLQNPYQCPHGRPVIVRQTRYELEKLFKRVV